jgi:hypothetical protein
MHGATVFLQMAVTDTKPFKTKLKDATVLSSFESGNAP